MYTHKYIICMCICTYIFVEDSYWDCQFFEWRIELLSDQGWRPEGIGGNWQNLTSHCHPSQCSHIVLCCAKPGRIFKASIRLGGRIPNQKINDHRDLSIIHENRLVEQRMFHNHSKSTIRHPNKHIWKTSIICKKMTLTYGIQKLLGKISRAPNSRWAPTKSKLSKPCRWTATFRGVAHPGIGDFKKNENFFRVTTPSPKKDHLAKIQFFEVPAVWVISSKLMSAKAERHIMI